jgi:hypothetical protein
MDEGKFLQGFHLFKESAEMALHQEIADTMNKTKLVKLKST